jgi:hypothetical protein
MLFTGGSPLWPNFYASLLFYVLLYYTSVIYIRFAKDYYLLLVRL